MTEENPVTQTESPALNPKEAQITESEKTPQTEANTEETTEAKPEKRPAWFTRVIAREAAEKREAKREAEQYKRQNAELLAVLAEKSGDPAKPKADTTILTQAEVDRQATEKANAILFNRECDKIAEQGNETYNDFQDSIGMLQSLGSNYPDLVKITVEMPEAHKILYHLGKNPDEAERLLSLPPARMALGLAKIESEISKAGIKTISNAPNPIKPIAAKSKAVFDPNDPNADREEWSKWREKTRRKR